VRYGGNTTCVEVRCGRRPHHPRCRHRPAQTRPVAAEGIQARPLNLTLLLSHTHWDHIQGLPFFAPIYESRCRLRILGCEGARKSLVAALTGQMESTYFPVPFSRLPSNIEIEELEDFNFSIGQVSSARTAPTIPA
jgi:phosphoribosyl 1,2-cyclic phosphodiesterase